MVHVPNPDLRLPHRRTSLRMVPPPERYYPAQATLRVAPSTEDEGFLATMRKLWRRRGFIVVCTAALGGAAILAAWSMPSFYVSEARVLVGIQAPRLLNNVEAVLADVSPDAERVQNEGFILQSRNIARQVIDQLKLKNDPEFNPELRKPSRWAQLSDFRTYLPTPVTAFRGMVAFHASQAARIASSRCGSRGARLARSRSSAGMLNR